MWLFLSIDSVTAAVGGYLFSLLAGWLGCAIMERTVLRLGEEHTNECFVGTSRWETNKPVLAFILFKKLIKQHLKTQWKAPFTCNYFKFLGRSNCPVHLGNAIHGSSLVMQIFCRWIQITCVLVWVAWRLAGSAATFVWFKELIWVRNSDMSFLDKLYYPVMACSWPVQQDQFSSITHLTSYRVMWSNGRTLGKN